MIVVKMLTTAISLQIYNELEEFLYVKRCQNLFDQSISEFVSCEYLERQIEEKFSSKIARLDQNDECCDAGKRSLEMQKKERT